MAQITNSLINTEAFTEMLFSDLNKSMLEAAEPELQKALKAIEVTMRRDMAANIIGFIESNYSVQTMNNNIVITVRQAKGSANSPLG